MATAPASGRAARAGSPPTREAAMAADPVAPKPANLAARTDSYFLKSKAIVGHFGDREASYAVFMRRPALCGVRFLRKYGERARPPLRDRDQPPRRIVGRGRRADPLRDRPALS